MEIQNVPISVLVKIVTELDIKDITSLRETYRHFRDMMNKPIFWEMYYQTIFKKTLDKENIFIWKDLNNLDFMIHDIDSMKSPHDKHPHIDCIRSNPQLIEIYFRFIGLDILNPSKENPTRILKYLGSYIVLRIFEHFSKNLLDHYGTYGPSTILATMVTDTPSKYIFQRIENLRNKIEDVEEDIEHGGIFTGALAQDIIFGFAGQPVSLLPSWRKWVPIMGLDSFLQSHIDMETVIASLSDDDDVTAEEQKYFEEFFAEFLC